MTRATDTILSVHSISALALIHTPRYWPIPSHDIYSFSSFHFPSPSHDELSALPITLRSTYPPHPRIKLLNPHHRSLPRLHLLHPQNLAYKPRRFRHRTLSLSTNRLIPHHVRLSILTFRIDFPSPPPPRYRCAVVGIRLWLDGTGYQMW